MRKWNNDNDYTVATSIVFVDNRDGDAFYSHSKQEKKKREPTSNNSEETLPCNYY